MPVTERVHLETHAECLCGWSGPVGDAVKTHTIIVMSHVNTGNLICPDCGVDQSTERTIRPGGWG